MFPLRDENPTELFPVFTLLLIVYTVYSDPALSRALAFATLGATLVTVGFDVVRDAALPEGMYRSYPLRILLLMSYLGSFCLVTSLLARRLREQAERRALVERQHEIEEAGDLQPLPRGEVREDHRLGELVGDGFLVGGDLGQRAADQRIARATVLHEEGQQLAHPLVGGAAVVDHEHQRRHGALGHDLLQDIGGRRIEQREHPVGQRFHVVRVSDQTEAVRTAQHTCYEQPDDRRKPDAVKNQHDDHAHRCAICASGGVHASCGDLSADRGALHGQGDGQGPAGFGRGRGRLGYFDGVAGRGAGQNRAGHDQPDYQRDGPAPSHSR